MANRHIDTLRPMKVIVIGAGISGILNAIKLQRTVQNLDLVIFDKNAGLGPAKKYDVQKYMRFSHCVTEARWNVHEAKWAVTVTNTQNGQHMIEHGDILITATGVLNLWEWPSIPGLSDFQGKLMHSADWDEQYSAQCLVSDQAFDGWITTYADAHGSRRRWRLKRSRNEVLIAVISATRHTRLKLGDKIQNHTCVNRKQIENTVQSDYDVVLRGSESQAKAKDYFRMLMAQRLSKTPELLDHFLPTFSPLCKRLTPGPGYLEALTEDNVDVVTAPIETIIKTGILTTDGKHREVDAIVCATGFDTHFTKAFPVYGVNGSQLFSSEQQGSTQRPANYLSVAVHDFPNMFMFLGSNEWGARLVVARHHPCSRKLSHNATSKHGPPAPMLSQQ
ncbi:hypothetical protein LTR74_017143 [Friedmanniomyces endolithicus]|nr:hypothetical protein LTR74_017143 [Friedmanniomyces endolithicus]